MRSNLSETVSAILGTVGEVICAGLCAAQMKLFEWMKIENHGDLVRLQLALEAMPDEKLMKALEKSRGKGRNDYPVRAMWNN